MNPAESTLLNLIRHALRQSRYTEDGEADWSAVFDEAKAQTVLALAGDRLPETVPKEDRAEWDRRSNAQLASYIRYLYAQDELCGLFAAHRIPMAILKGSAAAVYYPQPSLRAMGDIDLIVPEDRFSQAEDLMQRSGYTVLRRDKLRHTEFEKDGQEYELHRRFSREIDVERYITDGLQHLELGNLEGHAFPMLPKLANGLILLDHMRHHIKTGVGLRQLIDWMMYVERELDDAFWVSAFQAAAKEKDLDVLAITATRACQLFLGLPEEISWCSGANETLCRQLMETLLSSGNFGRKKGSGSRVEAVAINIQQRGFFRNLQVVGKANWKTLKRFPWLSPFAWLYQIFRYCRQMLRTGRRSRTFGDLRCSREKRSMMKKLHIDR